MVKMKLKRVIVTMAMIGICTIVPKETAEAGVTTFYEKEPNNSFSEAELITANREKPQGTIGDGQFVVSGSTTNMDEDFFKVYLNAGENYMTCNGNTANSYVFEIANNLGAVIYSDTYTKTAYGVTGYPFRVSVDGYYYVKIKGANAVSNGYLFSVGSPSYATSECRMRNGSITLSTAGQTATISYNFLNNTSIPENAIAQRIVINGVRTTEARSITVRNIEKASTVTLDTSIWSKNNLNSLELPIHSRWDATFAYNKQVTLTPEIQIYYIYPIVGQQLP